MESIEADYDSLRGILPKSEYRELDSAVLSQFLREIHEELDELNAEAVTLAATIKANFEELGI